MADNEETPTNATPESGGPGSQPGGQQGAGAGWVGPGQRGPADAGHETGWSGHQPAGAWPPPPPNHGWDAHTSPYATRGPWSGPQGHGDWGRSEQPWGAPGHDWQTGPGQWGGGPYAGAWPPAQDAASPRRRHRGAVAAAAVAAVVAMLGAGAAIGYAAAPSSSSSVTHSASRAPSGGSTSPGSSSGSGSIFGGGSGIGSGTSSGSSGSGSVSTAAGGPSDARSIAKGVDPALVDINTTLNYEEEDAAGTGMVLTSSGEILTNNHVIDGATSISVTDIGNGKTYSAKVVGYDRTDDVAVLQLQHASGLKTIHIGNSSSVKAGEAVLGIGNAGGSGGTPSLAGGSVTGLDKSITASDEGSGTSEQLHGLIESNAGIEPGDSGGPLVTTKGKVVGMDTAALSSSTATTQGTSSSEGFSIPINEAIRLAKTIDAHDSSSTVHTGRTAFLGVEVEAASSGASDNPYAGYGSSGTSPTSGVVIEEVPTGTPAATAGLAAGDVITSIDGTSVTSPNALTKDILAHKPGQSVRLGVTTAEGQSGTVSVTLASGPPQ